MPAYQTSIHVLQKSSSVTLRSAWRRRGNGRRLTRFGFGLRLRRLFQTLPAHEQSESGRAAFRQLGQLFRIRRSHHVGDRPVLGVKLDLVFLDKPDRL